MAIVAFNFISEVTFGTEDYATDIREQIITTWHALDSVEYRSGEIMENRASGEISTTIIDFSWTHDGRSAISWTREKAGKLSYLDERDDGSKLTLITFFPTPPKAIKEILIRPSNSGSSKHYSGKFFPSLWILLPGGESIADLLKDGAQLINEGTQRNPSWRLKHQINGVNINGVLDKNHGYLPSEIITLRGSIRRSIKVARFDQVDGFWYPAEGTATVSWPAYNKEPAGSLLLTFKIDQISFNRSVDPEKFVVREYPQGISLVNEVENIRTYVGGKLAHTRLQQEHREPKQKAPNNLPLKVAEDAGSGTRWWVVTTMIGVAAVFGGMAVYCRRRGF